MIKIFKNESYVMITTILLTFLLNIYLIDKVAEKVNKNKEEIAKLKINYYEFEDIVKEQLTRSGYEIKDLKYAPFLKDLNETFEKEMYDNYIKY